MQVYRFLSCANEKLSTFAFPTRVFATLRKSHGGTTARSHSCDHENLYAPSRNPPTDKRCVPEPPARRAHDVLVRAGSCRRSNLYKPHKIKRDKTPLRFLLLFATFSFKKRKLRNQQIKYYRESEKTSLSPKEKKKGSLTTWHFYQSQKKK